MHDVLDNDDFSEIRINFAQTTIKKIEAIIPNILKLENENNEAELKEIARHMLAEFHTIKGTSGAFQFECIKIICHKIEDIVAGYGILGLKTKVDVILLYCDAVIDYCETFLLTKLINENDFILKYKNIFDNRPIFSAKNIDNSSAQLQVNVLAIGLSSILIKNLQKSVPNFNFTISFAHNAADALNRIAKEKFHLILSSYFIEPINGLSLTMSIKNEWPNKNIKVVLLPSQDLTEITSKINPVLLPDQIIVKNQLMNSAFTQYLNGDFKSKKVSKVLFLDDDKSILDVYQVFFDDIKNIETLYLEPVGNWEHQVLQFSPDLIISDVIMPNVDILDFMNRKFLAATNDLNFIFISGDPDTELCKSLKNAGALGVFAKDTIIDRFFDHLSASGINLKKK